MRPGDLHDPLLRQVLPVDAEERIVPGFGLDAVGDGAAKKADGVIHKYRGRALLVATGSCAVNCRYCFRRHFPYAGETAAREGWAGAVAAIAADPSIEEVIVSGGDPLSLATPKLAELSAQLAAKNVTVTLSPEARFWLAKKGFDPAFGARPLGRLVQKEIKDVLADKILFGELAGGGTVDIGLWRDALDFVYRPR